MGAGNRDRLPVIPHQLSQKLRPCQDRKAAPNRLCIFRIIRMNRRGIDDSIDIICNIFRLLAIGNPRPMALQLICQFGFMGIRSGNLKSAFQKDLRKSAHADAADPNKVNVARLVKMNVIHICSFKLPLPL